MAHILLLVIIFATYSTQATPWNSGDGNIYKLKVVQDVWLERSNVNYNHYRWLIVARLYQFPLKRSLIQFQDLPSSCPLNKIRWAKMYVYFAYAHIASWHTVSQAPWLTHTINIHRIKKSWKESEATSTRRMILNGQNVNWHQQYLHLGIDAESHPICPATTIYTSRPSGFVEFDITSAVRSWKEPGQSNYGLLLKVINESANGRGIRFYSNKHADSSKHAFVNVMCDY